MSLIKKTKKLLKNPKAFLYDSRILVFNHAGRLLFPGIETKKLPVMKVEKRLIPNTTGSTAASNHHSPMRKLKVSMPPTYISNFWGVYKVMFDLNKSSKAFFPIGILSLDISRYNRLRNGNVDSCILPLWEFFNNKSLDEVESECLKAPELASFLSKKILNYCLMRGVKEIILPFNTTLLTRSIAIDARNFLITTSWYICEDLCGLPLSSRGDLELFNISDKVYLNAEIESLIKGFFESSQVSVLNGSPVNLSRLDNLKSSYGVGGNDNIYLFCLPYLTFAMDLKTLKLKIEAVLEQLLLEVSSVDHILFVGSYNNQDIIHKIIGNKLEKHYRKSFVCYNDVLDLQQLFKSCVKVILPRNYSSVFLSADNIIFYDLSEIKQDSLISNIRNPSAVCPLNVSDRRIQWSEDILKLDYLSLSLLNIERDFVSEVIAVPDPLTNLAITEGRQRHLLSLLNAKKRVFGAASTVEALLSEYFVQWGAEPSESKSRPEVYRSYFSRSRLYLEDGFIRSMGLWTDPNEPTCSIVLDTKGIYYDSTKPTLLEEILNSNTVIPPGEIERARSLISKIVMSKVSKYNYSPIIDLKLKEKNKKTILLVDQKAGDMSLKYGMADESSFENMLNEALSLGDDVEIIIKQHPCAINGSENEAHFTKSKLSHLKAKNIHFIAFDINPYSLINAVDEVWVVSSGMGFEALMAGKKVKCFGVPFYSNWGITEDKVTCTRRTRTRTLEEIFYIFYIVLSRYVHPNTGLKCSIEEIVDHFASAIKNRGK